MKYVLSVMFGESTYRINKLFISYYSIGNFMLAFINRVVAYVDIRLRCFLLHGFQYCIYTRKVVSVALAFFSIL